MPLTDDKAKMLAELQKEQSELENQEKAAAAEVKKAEKEKQVALEKGASDKVIEKKDEKIEIARVSESTAHALMEQQAELIGLLKASLLSSGSTNKELEERKIEQQKKRGLFR